MKIDLGHSLDLIETKKMIIKYGITSERFSWIMDEIVGLDRGPSDIFEPYLIIENFFTRAKKCVSEEDFDAEFEEEFISNYDHFLEEVNVDYEKYKILEI